VTVLKSQVKSFDLPLPVPRVLATRHANAVLSVSKSQNLIHHLLCLLIFTLIFEGIARKVAPQSLGISIFFLKDFVTFILLLLCFKTRPNPETSRLLGIMGVLLLLLSPCLLLTAFRDPILAVFGLKQYALFPTVAVAMCMAYIPNNSRQLFSLLRLVAISVVATTAVAVAQNRLPAANWLNLSVAGDDLSGFSAGGYLRVSSTFPFVGQYIYYANALCYCLPAFFHFNRVFRTRAAWLQILILIGLAIVGTFVTGSRGAVVGNAAILSAAGLLCIFFAGAKALFRVVGIAGLGIVLLASLQSQYPEFFAAYQARVDGTVETSHAVELEKRIENGLLGWTQGSVQAPPSLLGYGLGVMSNGSEKLSAYAAAWRSTGFWTESDQATTLFEGGWYLIWVWYGFRLWVIFYSFTLLLQIRAMESRLVACFTMGYILVIGVVGTLAIQPPLAIWWWLAVGLMTCLFQFDRMRPVKGKSQLAYARHSKPSGERALSVPLNPLAK
jgi:hypothetical protein